MGNKWSQPTAMEVDFDNPRFAIDARISLEKANVTAGPTLYGRENLHIAKGAQQVRDQVLTLGVLGDTQSTHPFIHISAFLSRLEQSGFYADAEAAAGEGANLVAVEHYYGWGLELPKSIQHELQAHLPEFAVYETIAKLRGRNRFPVHGIVYHPKDVSLPKQTQGSFFADMKKLFCK